MTSPGGKRYLVMDSGRTILYGLHGAPRSIEECSAFLAAYEAVRLAADPKVMWPAAVYRAEGLDLIPVADAGSLQEQEAGHVG